jgi:rhomboid family GlyGly-CTERM serine protease
VSGRLFFLAVGTLALALSAAGPRVLTALAYQRSSILRGQVWRLLTAHFVHMGGSHLLWNLGAAGLFGLAVAPALRARSWLAAALAAALAASLGVLVLQPEVRAMAGLSGLLHGLLATGAVAEVRRGQRLGWLFLGLLGVKVAWELLVGPTPLLRAALGGGIAVGAHACGALAGLAAGLTLPVEIRPAGRKIK